MRTLVTSQGFTRPADTTQYAAGDVMTAAVAATLQFLNLPNFQGSGGIIQNAVAVSSAAQATKLDGELWLFSSDITDLDADNGAFTPTDVQLLTLVGIVPFAVANWKAGDATSGAGGNATCVIANLGIAFSGDNLYGVMVARNTYTPVSGEVITVKLAIVRDYSRL